MGEWISSYTSELISLAHRLGRIRPNRLNRSIGLTERFTSYRILHFDISLHVAFHIPFNCFGYRTCKSSPTAIPDYQLLRIEIMKPNPLPFLREKWVGVAKPTTPFAGKRVLVTGANTGVGFEAAATFVSLGAEQVILAVRNADKGLDARRRIEARGQRINNIDVWELDMGNFASVQRFAARIEKELPRLDVAILNAGISPNDYVVGVEGWESILQVNVMATALLGLLLLPKLRASTAATHNLSHLIIVTSEAHRWLEPSDFPNPANFGGSILQAVNAKPLNGKKWDPFLQYARSKLFAMYVSESLAALAIGSNSESQVIVISICPGACKSDLTRDLVGKSFLQTFAIRIFDLLFNKATEQGGWSYVQAALLPLAAHGKWYKTTAVTQ